MINPRTAAVTMNSKRDLDDFMKKYGESSQYTFYKFMVMPFVETKINDVGKFGQMGQTNMPPMQYQKFPMNKFQNIPNFSKILLFY